MNINWQEFSPLYSTFGGVLIGISAVLLFAGLGRIAGITGIIAGLLQRKRKDHYWRLCFLAGLALAPVIYQVFAPLPEIQLQNNWSGLALSGLLVGVGTRLANGCTSGHGVCGLSRLSIRSLIATLMFMGSGFITVFVIHHLL